MKIKIPDTKSCFAPQAPCPANARNEPEIKCSLEADRLRVFTPGPVPIDKHILAIGATQPPYNRTKEFSRFTHEIVDGLKKIFQTNGSVALLTASGTAAMEAAVLNFLDGTDRVIIINGGTFGQRWCDLCDVHSISYDEIVVPAGSDVDLNQLDDRLTTGRYTALLVNAHETSTGQLYDVQAMGQLAHRSETFFIVDAISSICADTFSMDDWHVDVAILSSQKALALPPGLAFVAMSQNASVRLLRGPPMSLYFDLGNYLADQERGQLPYTPAIGLMLQLHQRLNDIQNQGLETIVDQHQQRANSFRQQIQHLPYSFLPSRASNAMTAVCCDRLNATELVSELQSRYNMFVAPSSGPLKSRVFRVSHMGAQRQSDITDLIEAIAFITS